MRYGVHGINVSQLNILLVFKRLVLCSMRAVDVEGPLLGNYIDFWSTKLKGGISLLDHDEVWLYYLRTCSGSDYGIGRNSDYVASSDGPSTPSQPSGSYL